MSEHTWRYCERYKVLDTELCQWREQIFVDIRGIFSCIAIRLKMTHLSAG